MKSKLLVLSLLLATLIPLFLITETLSRPAFEPAVPPDGKKVFISARCNNCHAVSSVGIEAKMKSEKMKGPDLKGVTSRHDTGWMAKYIKKEEQLEGKAHKFSFKGSDEELAALIDWLAEQK